MSAPHNPPAFPVQWDYAANETGMTLRDWFAGQALSYAAFYAVDSESHPMRQDFLPEEWAARMAYSFADAMLAERSK